MEIDLFTAMIRQRCMYFNLNLPVGLQHGRLFKIGAFTIHVKEIRNKQGYEQDKTYVLPIKVDR